MRFFSENLPRVAGLMLACAACGTATAQTPVAAPSSAPAPTSVPTAARADTTVRYSAADVTFMQGMIGHHQQAIDMVAMVPTHTQNAQLQLIARRIDVSQRDEMATMQTWLRERGQAVPATGEHAGHDMSAMNHAGMDHAGMPGMATPEEMARLSAARGADFDRLFLQLMIRHHQGALTMVERLLATRGAAQEPQTFGFAADVDADQRAEIARMAQLLAAMGDPPRP